MKAKDCGFNSRLNSSGLNLSYTYKHNLDLIRAKKLYKETGAVEYSKTDRWIKVGGVVINGVTKIEMERIIREVENGR